MDGFPRSFNPLVPGSSPGWPTAVSSAYVLGWLGAAAYVAAYPVNRQSIDCAGAQCRGTVPSEGHPS
jgi:hypothetical protein